MFVSICKQEVSDAVEMEELLLRLSENEQVKYQDLALPLEMINLK